MTKNVLLSLTGLCLLNFCGELPAQDGQPAFHWPDGKKVAVSLSFDDGRPSQVDVGLPLLDRHGVKATFYVNARSLDRRLDGWKKAAANGHEIGNHTNSHPCTLNLPFSRKNALEDYTVAMMEKELDSNNTEIARLLGVKPVTFAYPCGQKFIGRGVDVQSYVPLVARRFLAGRGFRDEGANDPVRCDMAQIMGMESDGLTFDQMKSLVATTAAAGGWLVFAGHEIGSPRRQTTEAAALEQLIQYAAEPSNGVWLDTVATVAKYVQGQRGGR